MPAENMLTSISKPALILPSHRLSSQRIVYAAIGAMIIAPMNMCTCPSCEAPSASPALKSRDELVGARDRAHDGDRRNDAAADAVDDAPPV